MSMAHIKSDLLAALQDLEIIDCHEHLGPESERLAQPVDALNLFGHYTRTDLATAGMPNLEFERMHDKSLPLDYRWGLLQPYLPQIRYGSYARAAYIAARELYGFDDISDETYEALSAAMQEKNVPGVYRWILRDKCKIRCSLTQGGNDYGDGDLLLPVMRVLHVPVVHTWEAVQSNARCFGATVNTLDDYVAAFEQYVATRKREEGMVGLKIMAQPFPAPDRTAAVEGWELLRDGQDIPAGDAHPLHPWLPTGHLHPLHTWLLDRLLEIAARQELIVATHSGLWGDFRRLEAGHMIPFFERHPNTRFDLYHLSFPQVHEAVVIGKNFANVWLNLCWTHIMSPTLAREGMREILDLVPVNKVFAFGGDYMSRAVDKVIGHLRMAQEDVAEVLAERIEAGLMNEEQALTVAKKWFWDNPVEAYRLEL